MQTALNRRVMHHRTVTGRLGAAEAAYPASSDCRPARRQTCREWTWGLAPLGAARYLVHERALEEPNFCLGWVHVHIDAIRRNLDEQMHLRAAFLDCRNAVRL